MHRFCLAPAPARSPPPLPESFIRAQATFRESHFVSLHIAMIDVVTLVALARLNSGQALDIVDAQ
jgi:hypothetical protein